MLTIAINLPATIIIARQFLSTVHHHTIKMFFFKSGVFLLCQLFLFCYNIVPLDMKGCIYHFTNMYTGAYTHSSLFICKVAIILFQPIISYQRFVNLIRVLFLYAKSAHTIRYDFIWCRICHMLECQIRIVSSEL